MKGITVLKVLMLIVIFAFPVLVWAQGPDPGPDPDAPIDGGLSLLIAAGVSYVAKKGYDKRKKSAEVPVSEK